MEQRGQEHDCWKELVEKAINVGVKVSLQPPSILYEMDQRCPRSNRLAHSPWPSHRPPLPKMPATTPLKHLCRLWHLSRPITCPPETTRPPTRSLGERRKSINVWINSGTGVEKTLAPPLLPALTARLEKICLRSRASTITRKGNTQGTALSPERTS